MRKKMNVWKTVSITYIVLSAIFMSNYSFATEVCIDKNGNLYLPCNEDVMDTLDITGELEIGAGGSLMNFGTLLSGRIGIGYYPLGLNAGFDLRGQQVVDVNSTSFSQRDLGVYLKYTGFPIINLSLHYLMDVAREKFNKDEESVDYAGQGIGGGIGLDVAGMFRFRTEVTYYQFLEKIADGETVKLTNDSENGMEVSLILTLPLNVHIDVD